MLTTPVVSVFGSFSDELVQLLVKLGLVFLRQGGLPKNSVTLNDSTILEDPINIIQSIFLKKFQ